MWRARKAKKGEKKVTRLERKEREGGRKTGENRSIYKSIKSAAVL